MQLFTYTYRHPVYRNEVTLDCAALDITAALASARRFLHAENKRLHAAGCPRVRLPRSVEAIQPLYTHTVIMRKIRRPHKVVGPRRRRAQAEG